EGVSRLDIEMMEWLTECKALGECKGLAGASLVGGAAALLMIIATLAMKGAREMLEASAEHITEGFVFAFRAMGSVLPIAGFFFLGASETAAAIFGGNAAETPSLLFDLVRRSEEHTSELQSRENLVCRLLLETK